MNSNSRGSDAVSYPGAGCSHSLQTGFEFFLGTTLMIIDSMSSLNLPSENTKDFDLQHLLSIVFKRIIFSLCCLLWNIKIMLFYYRVFENLFSKTSTLPHNGFSEKSIYFRISPLHELLGRHSRYAENNFTLERFRCIPPCGHVFYFLPTNSSEDPLFFRDYRK